MWAEYVWVISNQAIIWLNYEKRVWLRTPKNNLHHHFIHRMIVNTVHHLIFSLSKKKKKTWGNIFLVNETEITSISSCSISQLYQCSHCDSDWRRFLYDSLSLCEHIFTVDIVFTLTVIISCIFSLDSTDGQSEIFSSTCCSTATESRLSSWLEAVYVINEEFRSFSRFLLIPV